MVEIPDTLCALFSAPEPTANGSALPHAGPADAFCLPLWSPSRRHQPVGERLPDRVSLELEDCQE